MRRCEVSHESLSQSHGNLEVSLENHSIRMARMATVALSAAWRDGDGAGERVVAGAAGGIESAANTGAGAVHVESETSWCVREPSSRGRGVPRGCGREALIG